MSKYQMKYELDTGIMIHQHTCERPFFFPQYFTSACPVKEMMTLWTKFGSGPSPPLDSLNEPSERC